VNALVAHPGYHYLLHAERGMAYDAFMSYSHAADGHLAPALQSSLHRFAKAWWKLRAVKIFRDETSLAAAYDLTESIKQALDSAHFFILLASPGAAQSTWVEREVRLWLAGKAPENILIVLTQGTIAWDEAGDFDWSRTDALPRALAGAFRSEPLWVDLTWARKAAQLSMRDPRFQQAVARLAAPLHAKSLDEIAGEEVRQHRNTRRLVQAVVTAISLLAAAAATGAWFAHEGQRRAEQNLAQALAAVDGIETAVAKDLQDLAGVPVALRMKMLKGAETVLANLETGGEAAAVRGTRAVMLSEFAAAYGVLGSYADATARVQDATRILVDQVKSHPDDLTMRAALAKSHKVYGDVLWWQRKDLLVAIEKLASSVQGYAALIDSYPTHGNADDWRLFELRGLVGIGDIYYDGSVNPTAVCPGRPACLAQAQTYFTRALELALPLQNQDGSDFRWKNAILASRERLAKVYEALDDHTRAGTAYAELLAEYKRMSEMQPDNSKWQENLMALYWHAGGIEERSCRLNPALDNYTRALELARKLHQSEPERVDWSRELSLSLKHAARAYGALGQTAAAETHYRASLDINQDLIGKQPTNENIKTDVRQIETALAELGGNRPLCITASAH
jgi:tetratricopeptide (TPR) repeat protein